MARVFCYMGYVTENDLRCDRRSIGNHTVNVKFNSELMAHNGEFNSELMAHNGKINHINPIKDGFDRGNGAATLLSRLRHVSY